ncbi:MAG: enoyl-CoA hydratase [Streptosporangiaceae bacterium]|jgi:enoyl-CoA hydratase/carnithine racemase|nr:Enoyl-CoA hydratase [Streptosporangiaceae bacterium]MDX6429882.1 enoyl-CoA hydratase [Streptosporangiaceae bacterium]
MNERLRLEIDDDGVAVLTLAHPPLNIYDLRMRDELIEVFAAIAVHPDVRAMVLAADGKHFSAGADLKEFGTAESVLAARRIRWSHDPWTPLWELPQPTVVALHGYALGAGLEMSLLCDVRCASADTVLGLPETRLGMLPSAGGTQSLARTIPPGAAVGVVMLGENMTADEALRRGIIDIIATDVDAHARAIARSMASADSTVSRIARRALRLADDVPLEDGLRQERLLAARARRV